MFICFIFCVIFKIIEILIKKMYGKKNKNVKLCVKVKYTHDYKHFTKKYHKVEYYKVPKAMKQSDFNDDGELVKWKHTKDIPGFPGNIAYDDVEVDILSVTIVDNSGAVKLLDK